MSLMGIILILYISKRGNCIDKCRPPRGHDQMFSIHPSLPERVQPIIIIMFPIAQANSQAAHLQEFICNLDVCTMLNQEDNNCKTGTEVLIPAETAFLPLILVMDKCA